MPRQPDCHGNQQHRQGRNRYPAPGESARSIYPTGAHTGQCARRIAEFAQHFAHARYVGTALAAICQMLLRVEAALARHPPADIFLA
jgi:hypothetical protein